MDQPEWLEQWADDNWAVTSGDGTWRVSIPLRGGALTLQGPETDIDASLEIRLAGNAPNRKLRVEGDWPERTVLVNEDAGLTIQIAASSLLNARFAGRMTIDAQVPLSEPEFSVVADEQYPRINVRSGGQILDASGIAGIEFVQGGLVSGSESAPLTALYVRGRAAESGELDWVDLFSCGWPDLPVLQSLNRLNPAFPRRPWTGVDRGEALSKALAMDMNTTHASIASRRRGAFWERLARTLRQQGIGGSGEVATRYLAYELRRRSASGGSAEYWLLTLSKIFGYGTRVLLPLVWWLLGAVVSAWVLVDLQPFLADWFELGFDLFVLPMTFIRGFDSALLEMQWNEGVGSRIVITGMRILGFVCIAYSAVAIRTYTRIF